MPAEYLEIFRQMSFLTSVLAGFAITVAIELIALAEKKSLTTAAIAVFLVSSVISTAATFTFVLVMTSIIGPPGFPQPNEEWIIYFIGGIGDPSFHWINPIPCRDRIGWLVTFKATWYYHNCICSVSINICLLYTN